jgi:hypothetical protein
MTEKQAIKIVENNFKSYKTIRNLSGADIFHLYDSGEECAKNNSGFYDSRHFYLWAFNTYTNKKCFLGKHDGMLNIIPHSAVLDIVRVYKDGAFLLRFQSVVKIHQGQCIQIEKI